MLMPSLFKYFAFVGAALFAVLSLANFLLDPSTGATQVVATPAKRTLVVQHDPRASKVERWRDEQAALKAAEQTPPATQAQQTQTSANASPAAKSTVVPAAKPTPAPAPAVQAAVPAPQPAAAQPQPQPVAQVAAVVTAAPEPAQPQPASAVATETSSIMGVAETTDDRAAKAAERKAKIAKAKARKEKLARDRAIAAQTDAALNGHYPRTASNTQDQYYYGGARGGQQPFQTRYSSAFAPQQSFGPFGWGRGW
jgi:hypothetical protein